MIFLESHRFLQHVLIIKQCVTSRNFDQALPQKQEIKKKIWERDNVKWKISCYMYEQLHTYLKIIPEIGMHPCWNLVRLKPYLSRQVAAVMSVLQGGQPRGMQRNFDKNRCLLCDTRENDTPQHILFECVDLSEVRQSMWPKVINCMPSGMASDVSAMRTGEITTFIISGLRGKFIIEWVDVYENMARFIYTMYKERSNKYEAP